MIDLIADYGRLMAVWSRGVECAGQPVMAWYWPRRGAVILSERLGRLAGVIACDSVKQVDLGTAEPALLRGRVVVAEDHAVGGLGSA